MSHYSEFEMELKDRDCVVAALREMGLVPLKVESTRLHAFDGEEMPSTANVIVPRASMGGRCADIGFMVRPNGNSTFHVDEYQNPVIKKAGGLAKFMGKFKQLYAVHVIEASAKSKGKKAQRVTEKNGTMKVLVHA